MINTIGPCLNDWSTCLSFCCKFLTATLFKVEIFSCAWIFWDRQSIWSLPLSAKNYDFKYVMIFIEEF